MTAGLVADLAELIALQRIAQAVKYAPEHRALRAGHHLSKLRGRGMDFAEARNYQAGDEIRHMEWRVTARTGRPHIKLYQEERERPVIILTDFSASMYFGTRGALKSVVAARLASALAWTVIKEGDRVGGVIFSETNHHEFAARSRERGLLPFLASLSAYTQDNQAAFVTEQRAMAWNRALSRLHRVIKPGSILVLISDFYQFDTESQQHLSRLRAHNDMLAYHVCDAIELAPPKPARYALSNGQQDVLLDTSQPSLFEAYQRHCSQKIALLTQSLRRLQVQYVVVTAETDLAQLVRRSFPRRSHGAV